jgi:hypothetical protein
MAVHTAMMPMAWEVFDMKRPAEGAQTDFFLKDMAVYHSKAAVTTLTVPYA